MKPGQGFRYPDSRLLIFAKAPVPGQVNTRLIPALGAEGAAQLAEKWLTDKVALMVESQLCPVILCVSPDDRHSLFQSLVSQYPLHLEVQTGGDLGERMFNALQSSLKQVQSVVLIGTDCPELGVEYLEAALACLNKGVECVIGPATDGGYVLFGAKRIKASCFTNIRWGSDGVCVLTQQRLKQEMIDFHLLPVLRDIDRPEDL